MSKCKDEFLSKVISFRILLSFMSLKRPSRNSEEEQVTKEERWPEKYSGNMDPGAHTSLVRFTLAHEQALGGACVLVHPAQGVFREYRSCQVRRMSLSYLSCGRAVELEAPL